jgi:hypothetical protein
LTPFTEKLLPTDVGQLIDLTKVDDPATQSMAQLQLEGVATLYNILCEHPLAYLADEVGMGKTYQALALAALVWNENPHARLLFVSPRANLQIKWIEDYKRFFASNYRRPQGLGDDRVVSVMFNEPVYRPTLFDNLRSWTPLIGRDQAIAPFVRHTSFMRPVYLTSRDLMDMEALWQATKARFNSWGLFEVVRPRELKPDNASSKLNLTFAYALNGRLSSEAGEEPYFDLVIVDEAQCLRNPYNQSNQVFFEALKGQVRKWLFMSATPAHGGPEDLPAILNRYPQVGEILSPDLVRDLPAMQHELKKFMVRRQRRYRTVDRERTVGKTEYRNHDEHGWAIKDAEMGVLGTLSMGLVQKGLVGVLQGRSNRYRIGFLSSFESLQSSVQGVTPLPVSEDDELEETRAPDWYGNQPERQGEGEAEAPDTGFIHKLSSDFENRFERPLHHPKVDSVADHVASLAFGDANLEGGQKFLIFTRRVSTVEALRYRITLHYLKSIEARARRCWKVKLDWSGKNAPLDEVVDTDDPEGFEVEPEGNPLRQALAEKGWLYRYRQTFRTSGRNALFFEDGWLQRLCTAGGVDPLKAASALSDQIWAESWAHAAHAFGSGKSQYRADRVRYLALHGVLRESQAFGLDERSAKPWQNAYEICLHNHLEREQPDDDPHRNSDLFTESPLWNQWDSYFPDGDFALPAANPEKIEGDVGVDELCRRQVARTLLGQTLRLSDTLLDLYFADQSTQKKGVAFTKVFLDWLSGCDASARQLRRDIAHWIKHLRLIVDSSLEGAGRGWRELAREESWKQLFNLSAVVGVTGGSGAHQQATRQFRTPSLPRVIVCTDTLKEGVDLHLFCDQVLHYGVAWTSGDQEQRVGRVDRFFSQIERRLSSEGKPPQVQLQIGYPHVVASLEREQVGRVIERQRQAEALMDSPLAGAQRDDRNLVAGASIQPSVNVDLGPFHQSHFNFPGRDVVAVSKFDAGKIAEHYRFWYKRLIAALRQQGWEVSPDSAEPVRRMTIHQGQQYDLEWTFDASMGRYVLTLSDLPWPENTGFSAGTKYRIVDRTRQIVRYVQLLVPLPEEGQQHGTIDQLIKILTGDTPTPLHNARADWGRAIESLTNSQENVWESEHKARVTVSRGDRSHTITLYAYQGGVRIVGVIASIDELGPYNGWGTHPTAGKVREWVLDANSDLPSGYLDVHERDGLVFGVHILHGEISEDARYRLLQEVAWRADAWEASLLGADNY